MNVTSSGLTKAAAAAAAVAGLIFIAVQVNHPAIDTYTTDTADWVVRNGAKAVMAALALTGITGMYLRQHVKAGLLGLVGYVAFAVGYLLMFSVEMMGALVLPNLVDTQPQFINDVLTAATGGQPVGDIGGLQALLNAAGAGYMIGGLLFGIALFRTRVLARWAAVLLAISTIATLALAVLPEAFNRPFAVPEGIALIGLGVSLWRNPTDPTADAAAGSSDDSDAAPAAATA